jgi:hypothetical protein
LVGNRFAGKGVGGTTRSVSTLSSVSIPGMIKSSAVIAVTSTTRKRKVPSGWGSPLSSLSSNSISSTSSMSIPAATIPPRNFVMT